MQSKLNVTPLVLQLPCGTGHNFDGVVDLVEMQTLPWGAGDEGQTVERQPLLNSHPLWDEAVEARGALIESLAAVDDNFAEHLLEADEINYLAVESGRIRAAVRNANHRQEGDAGSMRGCPAELGMCGHCRLLAGVGARYLHRWCSWGVITHL